MYFTLGGITRIDASFVTKRAFWGDILANKFPKHRLYYIIMAAEGQICVTSGPFYSHESIFLLKQKT